ncbi:hypothetical protein ACLKMY_33860 [Paraburkholderia mimosarum]|uniref:hypothetical protein n=1 Tax=Paraburkholderia mimosarum TaxID=312026 RepID=UPI0012B54CF0|nr:hypothetical protein [Paraburkholderia mimosarum]
MSNVSRIDIDEFYSVVPSFIDHMRKGDWPSDLQVREIRINPGKRSVGFVLRHPVFGDGKPVEFVLGAGMSHERM